MVLVVGNRALPFVDGLVLAHENLLGNLIQKTEVVGHDDTSTGEGLARVSQPASIVTNRGSGTYVDGIRKRVNGWDIETVGRLIEQQHVGTVDSKLESYR